MTLKQIEKTRGFLTLIDSVQGLTETQKLVEEMKAFYGDDFNVHLEIETKNTLETYTHERNVRDKLALKGLLESFLAKESRCDEICYILDLIAECNSTISDEKKRRGCISKIYYAFNGKIKFDDMVKTIATAPDEAIAIYNIQATEAMVMGVIAKLRFYANELSQVHKRDVPIDNKQEININPQISVSATNNTSINISAVFENARQQAADEGLSDEQYHIVMDKLSELEKLANSKEKRGQRWQKAKEFMKWLCEQGIQVAGILLPVLAHTIR